MKKNLLKIGLFAGLTIGSLNAQTYLSENFDGTFTGSPAAPAGWTQTRIVAIGDAIPEGPGVDGEQDWMQNTNSGSAWSIVPPYGVLPLAAVSGSSALYIEDCSFGSTSNALGSRRMESPVVNIASSTNPFVRFQYFSGYSSNQILLRVVASNDGGATWQSIMGIAPNANVSAFSSATPWQKINVKIPTAFKVANAKFGLEMTNSWGVHSIIIDDFKVEEYTPTTYTSVASGAWNNTATWSGSVVPTCEDNVVIAATHSVLLDFNINRCQNITIDGVLQYSTTSTTQLFQVFGDMTINATGTYSSCSGATGKRTYFGGNIINNGILNFQPGTSITGELVWLGYTGSYSGSGVIANNRIPKISHGAPGGVNYLSPVTVSNFLGIYLGSVNNTNLTIGNPPALQAVTIERYLGSLTTTLNVNTTNIQMISNSYVNPLTTTNFGMYLALTPTTITTGNEIPVLSGIRHTTGNLILNTHNNINLSFPLTVGTTTTTSNLTCTRGIISTSTLNLLMLNSLSTGVFGLTPSTITSNGTNGGNHGSYVNGPMQIRFPATGTTARNYPLGQGAALHTNLPSSNVLRTLSLGGTTAWNTQTITASIEAAPSGAVSGSLSAVFGSRAYRLNYNGGATLGAGNTITLRYNNSTFGGSDALSGNLQDVRLVQAPTLTGSWVERSLPSGSGAMAPNTLYTIVSNSTSVGPLSGDEYFAWATVASVCSGVPATGSITGAMSSCGGAATTLTFSSPSTTLAGISQQWATSSSSVGPFTNMGTALTQNTGTLASTMFYIVTTSCSISGSTAVSPVYTLVLNPNPTVTAVSSSSIYCSPSTGVISFSATGANSYTWSPSASLSSSVGANVTGTLSSSTVFSVMGTSTTGCNSANATVAINVIPGVSSISISASSSTLCAGNSSSLALTYSNNLTPFCTPPYSSGTGFGDYISYVGLSTLSNTTTGLAAPYYTLYPQSLTTTTLTAGSVYTLNFQAGTWSANDFAAWIDYNQDNSFQPSEKLGQVDDLPASPANGTITFTVPLTALNGTNVRLRLREMDGFSIILDPCASQSSYGEAEDYEITIVGGITPSESFAWTPTTALSTTTLQNTIASPTTSTNYSVTVTNIYGCSAQSNYSLTVAPSPTIAITGPTVACSGASVTLTANGASTYTWNIGPNTNTITVSPTVATTYTAIGTSTNGCNGSKTITVNSGANPTITITGATTVCPGNSTTLTANGANTYSWNTGATTASITPSPTVLTTYTATGTSSIGCTGNTIVTVTVNSLPVVNLTPASNTTCVNGNSITLFGSPTGGVYSGTNVTGSSFAPGATAGSFTPVYTFTNTQGCSNSATTTINVIVCSGINEKTTIAGLNVYPNPNNGTFVIELNNNDVKTINITDVTGRVVYSVNTTETKQYININALANGIYFAQISTQGKTSTYKIVKE